MSPERMVAKIADLEKEVLHIRKDMLALAKRMQMAFQTPS